MQGKHRLSEETPSTAAEDLIARLKLATDDPLTQPTGDTVLASESETDGESEVKAKKFQDVEPGVYHGDEHEDLFLLNTMPGSYSREQLGENAQPQVVCCDLAARLAARGITATTGWCIPEGEYPVGFTGQYLIGFYDEGERTIKRIPRPKEYTEGKEGRFSGVERWRKYLPRQSSPLRHIVFARPRTGLDPRPCA